MEEPALKIIYKLRSPVIGFIPKVYLMAGITDKEEAELPKVSESITAQSNYSDFRLVIVSAGKPNTRFHVDNGEVLFRVSHLGNAS